MRLVQFANLFKDGAKVKMSTRSGDFYSLSDLIKEIEKGIENGSNIFNNIISLVKKYSKAINK